MMIQHGDRLQNKLPPVPIEYLSFFANNCCSIRGVVIAHLCGRVEQPLHATQVITGNRQRKRSQLPFLIGYRQAAC